jgi:hypothetical protein
MGCGGARDSLVIIILNIYYYYKKFFLSFSAYEVSY